MADYYTRFSAEIERFTPEERSWIEEQLGSSNRSDSSPPDRQDEDENEDLAFAKVLSRKPSAGYEGKKIDLLDLVERLGLLVDEDRECDRPLERANWAEFMPPSWIAPPKPSSGTYESGPGRGEDRPGPRPASGDQDTAGRRRRSGRREGYIGDTLMNLDEARQVLEAATDWIAEAEGWDPQRARLLVDAEGELLILFLSDKTREFAAASALLTTEDPVFTAEDFEARGSRMHAREDTEERVPVLQLGGFGHKVEPRRRTKAGRGRAESSWTPSRSHDYPSPRWRQRRKQ